MSKAFVVIKNSVRVVARFDSKSEAEAYAEAERQQNPGAVFEFGKLDKKIFNTRTEVAYSPAEEVY